jgi:hypothetical protein
LWPCGCRGVQSSPQNEGSLQNTPPQHFADLDDKSAHCWIDSRATFKGELPYSVDDFLAASFWFLRKKPDPMRKQLGKRYTNCRLGVHHVSAIASPGYQIHTRKRCAVSIVSRIQFRGGSLFLLSVSGARALPSNLPTSADRQCVLTTAVSHTIYKRC